MPQEDQDRRVDPALACFVLLARFLGVPADANQITHERGGGEKPFTLEDLSRVARRLGLIGRIRRSDPEAVHRLPLPAIAELSDGDAAILLKVEDESETPRILVQLGDGERPEIWSFEELRARFSGRLLLMTSRERMTGASRPFDISWFIPALVRYRRSLRDVLIASFFMQVMALVTPIFFQVVIDKVLVHQALGTLDVIAIGLAVVLVWETALSGLRTWLFAHTTNRVDAELSAGMFKHLVSLPLSYFESRRVGDSVARVRELERIREFLTSNAVTLVLDLFFTVVFFAVMFAYSVTLTLIVLGSIPLYVLVSLFITPPLRARLDEKFQRGAENQAFLVETVSGIGTLKAMAVEPQMREKWEKQFAGYIQTGFAVTPKRRRPSCPAPRPMPGCARRNCASRRGGGSFSSCALRSTAPCSSWPSTPSAGSSSRRSRSW